MTAKQMLQMGGFPDTVEGRQAFYRAHPTKESFMKKYAKGGSLAFPQAPTANQIFSMGMPATFPGPFYAAGGSHMPLVHYRDAGQVDPQAMQAMMDNQGGNIPFATRQPGGPPIEELPRYEEGGMDPKAMAEQILAIKEEYSTLTPRELKKELQNIQEEMASGYSEDPSLPMKQVVISELLGQDMPMAQTGGIAFPQQPDPNQFFTGAHFDNEYRKGGAPCYKCGGMYDAGGNTPFNYGYFPMSMAAGGDIGLDTSDNSDYLSYNIGGESIQGQDRQQTRDGFKNQFTQFLGNTSDAYTAGQVMQQGQMQNGMQPLPQNNMGGYDANYNMNYGPQYDTDSFSSVNPNVMGNISAREDAMEGLTIPGAGNKFMGSMFDLMATRNAQKQNAKGQAKYGRFLPKHQTPPGNTTGATNTGAGTTPSYLTKEDVLKLLEEQKKTSQQGNQQQTVRNPYTGEYVNAGYNYMGSPANVPRGKVIWDNKDSQGNRSRGRYKGALFPFAGVSGNQGTGTQGTTTQGAGTQGTTTQGQGAGTAAGTNDYAKYIEALGKAGFTMDKESHKRGLFRNKDVYKYHFGNPASQQGPVQGAAQNPNAGTLMNPSKIANPASSVTPNIPATQYPATQSNSGVDLMNEKFADESGVDVNTMRRGGSYDDDVIWMDEDDIRRFEAGGGVLQYLDGGEFKQYY